MLIFLNPKAGGRRAMERWETFCREIRRREIERADIILTGAPASMKSLSTPSPEARGVSWPPAATAR